MLNRTSAADFGSPDRLDIPSRTVIVTETTFPALRSVREVGFGRNSRCRLIDGFCDFSSLARISIPSSVEIVSSMPFRIAGRWLKSLSNRAVALNSCMDFRDAHPFPELSFLHRLR
jgi:hypothetical protein